jgi:tetrahydromethanopterin S-methyltransferase subunit G
MPDFDARVALETPADAQIAALQELRTDIAGVVAAQSADAAMLLGELRSLKEDLHARFQQVDGRLQRIDGRFQQVDGRLLQIDGRFLQIDGRFLQMKSRFQQADEKIDRHFALLVGILIAAIAAFITALIALYLR